MSENWKNERTEYPDGSRLYVMVRPNGSNGRLGLHLRTKAGESRGSIANQLRRSRGTLQGIRRVVG